MPTKKPRVVRKKTSKKVLKKASKKASYDELVLKLARLEAQEKLKKELPHLFAFPDYAWGKEFKESTNRMRLLCAANQVSKSSTMICDAIEKACNKEEWPKFFTKREPQSFWYIYPDFNKVEEELSTKWPEFLPKGSAKESGPYAWRMNKMRSGNPRIEFFNADVTITFKTWKSDLQSGTLDGLFIDEELPEELYPELAMRLARYTGMLSMVFTATLNQPFWYDAIERIGQKNERFKEAAKWQVSMEHDCQFYADGSLSPWTPEAVQHVKNTCGSQTEIDRRVHGRFVTEVGLKYPTFDQDVHIKKQPKDRNFANWLWYSGVDIGSSGKAHPAAIAIIAVKPDFTLGVVKKLWRGNESERTTSMDILEQYKRLTSGLVMTAEYYDWASADFGTIAQRHGYSFLKANKNKDEDVLNLLFKNRMLEIDKDVEHLDDLKLELKTLKVDTPKQKASDDLVDALRYASSSVFWNIASIKSQVLLDSMKPKEQPQSLGRTEQVFMSEIYEQSSFEDDISDFNELIEGYY